MQILLKTLNAKLFSEKESFPQVTSEKFEISATLKQVSKDM